MSPQRFQRINELADAALELSAEGRSLYLDESCGGDRELRLQVERLVAAHNSTDAFLVTPALHLLAAELTGSPVDLAGSNIGRYEVISRLGAGGHGEVWLARDPQLSRQIAIKLLTPEFASHPEHIARFNREARTTSTLNHPNIVTIYEIGQAMGRDFIAQEFVDGDTLRERIANGPLPVHLGAAVATQAATALDAAHAAGVVHRDIKPENLMLRPDGLVKVLDFGLARTVKAGYINQDLTQPGLLMGTVKYMSPEQVRGQEVDARTDLFSLGVVLYEMITGAPPFAGPSPADTVAAILHHEPAPLSESRKGVPPELERVIRLCLEKDRAQRYQTASQLREDLSRLARHTEVSPPRRFSLKAFIAIPALLAALAAGLLIYRAARTDPDQAAFNSMRISLLTTRGQVSGAAISQDGRYVAYVLKEGSRQSLWMRQFAASGDLRILGAETGEYRDITFSPDSNYLYYVRTDAAQPDNLFKIPVLGGPAQSVSRNVSSPVAFSPDGTRIAFIRRDTVRWEESLVIATSDGSGERTVTMRRRPQYFSRAGLAWAPNGQSILCATGNSGSYDPTAFRLVEIRISDGTEKAIGSRTWAWTSSILRTGDGRSLLVSAGEHSDEAFQIWRVSYPDGRVRRVTNDLSNYAKLSLTSDSKTLLALRTEKTADLWTTPPGSTQATMQVPSGNLHSLESVARMADGGIVYTAIGGEYRNVWIVDGGGGNPRQLTAGPYDKSEVAVTRDGRYILYKSQGKIWRMNADGTGVQQLTHGSLDAHPSTSPDGRWVVYASFPQWSPVIGGKPTLWKIGMDGGEPVQLTTFPSSMPEVSPDGQRVACAYYQNDDPKSSRQIAVVPISGGPPLKRFDRPPAIDDHVHWTIDGKALEYTEAVQGTGNVWQQPLKGGSPFQVTDFKNSELFFFDTSARGRVLARGRNASDVILITDF